MPNKQNTCHNEIKSSGKNKVQYWGDIDKFSFSIRRVYLKFHKKRPQHNITPDDIENFLYDLSIRGMIIHDRFAIVEFHSAAHVDRALELASGSVKGTKISIKEYHQPDVRTKFHRHEPYYSSYSRYHGDYRNKKDCDLVRHHDLRFKLEGERRSSSRITSDEYRGSADTHYSNNHYNNDHDHDQQYIHGQYNKQRHNIHRRQNHKSSNKQYHNRSSSTTCSASTSASMSSINGDLPNDIELIMRTILEQKTAKNLPVIHIFNLIDYLNQIQLGLIEENALQIQLYRDNEPSHQYQVIRSAHRPSASTITNETEELDSSGAAIDKKPTDAELEKMVELAKERLEYLKKVSAPTVALQQLRDE